MHSPFPMLLMSEHAPARLGQELLVTKFLHTGSAQIVETTSGAWSIKGRTVLFLVDASESPSPPHRSHANTSATVTSPGRIIGTHRTEDTRFTRVHTLWERSHWQRRTPIFSNRDYGGYHDEDEFGNVDNKDVWWSCADFYLHSFLCTVRRFLSFFLFILIIAKHCYVPLNGSDGTSSSFLACQDWSVPWREEGVERELESELAVPIYVSGSVWRGQLVLRKSVWVWAEELERVAWTTNWSLSLPAPFWLFNVKLIHAIHQGEEYSLPKWTETNKCCQGGLSLVSRTINDTNM